LITVIDAYRKNESKQKLIQKISEKTKDLEVDFNNTKSELLQKLNVDEDFAPKYSEELKKAKSIYEKGLESAKKGGSLITAELANDYSRDVFAYPGDISREYSKGCNYLIQKNHYDFCLVLTGFDSFNKKHVESLVSSYNLNNQVYFIGFAPIEEIIWLYKNAFALVYPSYAGPENLPPLEAFYFGCPVVASKINGSDEQLGNAALLCNPSSFEEFAESLLSLKQDHELRSLLISRG
jgi:glycosyltransferase involved in cell wall biosynthesis